MTLERQALLISYLIFYRFFIFDILNNITIYFPELIKEKSVESNMSDKSNINIDNIIPPSCPPKKTDNKDDFIDDDVLSNKTTKTFKLAQSVLRYKYNTLNSIRIKKETIIRDKSKKDEKEKSVKFNLKDDDDNMTNKTKKSKKKKSKSRKTNKDDSEFIYDLDKKKILLRTKTSFKKKNKTKKRNKKEKCDNESESNDYDYDNNYRRNNKRNKSTSLYNNNDKLTNYKNNSYIHHPNIKNSYTQTQLPYNNNSYSIPNQNNNNKQLFDSIYNKVNDLNKPNYRNIIYNGENPYNNYEPFIPYARPVKLPFINSYNDYNNPNFYSFNNDTNSLYRRNCYYNNNYNLYPNNNNNTFRNSTNNIFSNNNRIYNNFPMTYRNNSNSIFYNNNNNSQQFSNSFLKLNSPLSSRELNKHFLPNFNSSIIKNDNNKINNNNPLKLVDDKINFVNDLKRDKKKKKIIEKNLSFISNILNYIISSKLKENIQIYHEGYTEEFLYKLMILNKKNERYFYENNKWLQLYKITSYQFGIDIAQRCMDKYNY